MRFFSIIAALTVVATASAQLTVEDIVGTPDGKACLRRRQGSSATVTSLEQCKGVCNSWFPSSNMVRVKRGTVTNLSSCLDLCNSFFPSASSAAAVKPSSSSARPSSSAVAQSSSKAPASSSSKASVASSSASSKAPASSSSKASVASSSKPPVASSSKALPASSSKAAVPSSAAPAPSSSSKAAAPSSQAPSPSASSASSPVPTDPVAKAFVEAHNTARAAYGAGPVTWNNELAAFAATVANKCKMAHSGGAYGENLAAGTGNYGVTNAMKGWMDEASLYNYNSPGFSSATGHFTQVVWKGTSEIGCAISTCADGTIFTGYGNSNLIVCEYKAPGNYQGRFPDNVGRKI